jgi:hypothetical protein
MCSKHATAASPSSFQAILCYSPLRIFLPADRLGERIAQVNSRVTPEETQEELAMPCAAYEQLKATVSLSLLLNII